MSKTEVLIELYPQCADAINIAHATGASQIAILGLVAFLVILIFYLCSQI